MSSPYWILKIDRQIRDLVEEGIPPKRIAILLSLSSVWVVYRAMRRLKCSTPNRNAKERQTIRIQK